MKIKMKTISKNRGFTLIEMMVSVSIFVIVALIVSGVLVQLSAAYKKAQAMRLLMDNLNFALEKINLELREGVNISLSEREGVQFDRLGGGTFCYKKETIDSRDTLVKCAGDCTTCPDPKDMLAEGITLKQLNLKLYRTGYKARVIVGVKGEARSWVNLTDFYIQTTASQRTNDL